MRSVPDSGEPLRRCQAEIDEKRSAAAAGLSPCRLHFPRRFSAFGFDPRMEIREPVSSSTSCQGAFPAACFPLPSALDGDVLKVRKAASVSPRRLTNRAPTSRSLEEKLRASHDRQTDGQQRAGSSWILQVSAPNEQGAMLDLASMTPSTDL
jgi:hypothetical protein